MLLLAGCMRTVEEPLQPDGFTALVGDASCRLLRWDAGLEVMVLFEHNNYRETGRSAFKEFYQKEATIQTDDDQVITWDIETTDGKTGLFRIDKTPYELTKGALFVIRVKDQQPDVLQLNQDLSAVQVAPGSCATFVQSDPQITQFLPAVTSKP